MCGWGGGGVGVGRLWCSCLPRRRGLPPGSSPGPAPGGARGRAQPAAGSMAPGALLCACCRRSTLTCFHSDSSSCRVGPPALVFARLAACAHTRQQQLAHSRGLQRVPAEPSSSLSCWVTAPERPVARHLHCSAACSTASPCLVSATSVHLLLLLRRVVVCCGCCCLCLLVPRWWHVLLGCPLLVSLCSRSSKHSGACTGRSALIRRARSHYAAQGTALCRVMDRQLTAGRLLRGLRGADVRQITACMCAQLVPPPSEALRSGCTRCAASDGPSRCLRDRGARAGRRPCVILPDTPAV